MNSKGQAALEYLMTYGWALIVIAIVVGVLVFIVSSPAGNVVCNSNDPAKIMVKASQIPGSFQSNATDIATIKITNLTGGNISSASCTATGAFLSPVAVADGCTTDLTSGGEWTFSLNARADTTGSPFGVSTILISYVDYATLSRTATITCSGPISVTA